MAPGTAEGSGGLRIELLGPVEARFADRRVALGGQRPRALFAVLTLMAGRLATIDELIDALWGDDPPARARDSLQMHVSRLRKALTEAGEASGPLVSQAGGYLLDLPVGVCDVDNWHERLADVRQARETGELATARAGIEEALRLWRGRPLGGVVVNSLLAGERGRLEEERLGALVEGIELDLELGRHGELLGQVDALVVAHPYQERLVELQMLALYRSGRQADALSAFHAARGRFVGELGIEPSQRLRDVHEHVLKHSAELSPPVTLASGETTETAASPSIRPRARRLPVPPNRTIGRGQELAAITARLVAGQVRLLTLTGPGGVGKTRLAVEAARAVEVDFADGARFVPLAAVHRSEELPSAVVDALEIVVLSGETPAQATARFLAAKHLLLVVDNAEHLLAGASFIGGLLEACPALTILATSRQPFALQAEERHPVSPLALPAPGTPESRQELAGVDAVALFCERARAYDPDFSLDDGNARAIAQICRRVDGLPLAVELAAARCALLSPAEIAERLDEALAAPGAGARDAAARQQTLRATVDWSHALLDTAERNCFARFAALPGGGTIDAAEAVTGAGLGTLDALVTKSLLVRRQHAHAPTRLRMLETVRSYAAERLEVAADRDEVHARQYRFFLALAQRHGSDRALCGAARQDHAARLDAEIDNIHEALAWSLHRPDPEPALAMCVALSQYWSMRNRYTDALEWTDQALEMPGADAYPTLRVRALCSKALALWPLWRQADNAAVLAEAETVARALGDPLILSQALQVRARIQASDGIEDGAEANADEALHLAEATDNGWAIAMAAYATVVAAPTLATVRECVDRAATLLDEAGNLYHLARVLAIAAYSALYLGSEHDAKTYIDRATPVTRALDDPQAWMFLLGNAGMVALVAGDTDAADHLFREHLGFCREVVSPRFAYDGLLGLSIVAATRDETHRSARLAGAAAAHRDDSPPDPVETQLHTDHLQPARTLHGTDAWDAAARDGATLGLEQAIDYALQHPRP